MIFSILLGAAAAWISPRFEEQIAGLAATALPKDAPVEGVELSLLTFAFALLIAAALAEVLGHSNGIALALGAVLGVIGPRLMAKWREGKAPDYDN